MRVGTKSLLFGVHQVILHPLFVWLAWRKLYGWPSWRECVCILIHDWGYWGAPNMDGPEGERHPILGACLARDWVGDGYYELVLLHSRHWARLYKQVPSRLCWADKLGMVYMPARLYMLLGNLSGEIDEYHNRCVDDGFLPRETTHEEWYRWVRKKFVDLAMTKDPAAAPYHSSVQP